MTLPPADQAPKPQLGRLEEVDPRQVWLSEPREFTPWLAQAENISLLSEAIGIELVVESTERGVGPFRADILCKDTVAGHYVLIENQLELTDHIHLGQLLTYAAGLDAVTIVWVARRFTDEHRAAIDWLNRITDPEINFFGLEIQIWRIGDSLVAPKFNIVCQPNDWQKAVRQSAGAGGDGAPSGMGQLHLEFWTQFRQYMQERGSPVRMGTPSTDHWKVFAVGRSGFELQAANGMRDGYSQVNLAITGAEAGAHFRLLEQRYRQQVDATLGPDIRWSEVPNRNARLILIRRTSNPADRSTWPELNAWFAEHLEKMNTLFRPIVAGLDASEYVAPASDATASDGRADE